MNPEIERKLLAIESLISEIKLILDFTPVKKEPEKQPAIIRLTRDMIEDCRTPRGGFTARTMAALGQDFFEAKTGWINRLIGTSISLDDYRKALDSRIKRKRK